MIVIRLFFGIAEIILALVVVFVAVTSSHPSAWIGYILALVFASNGFLYIITADDEEV
jgi:hypothetical protein